MVLVGPFDTPKQSRVVIKTLDITQSHKIRYRNKILPLKLVNADQIISSDIKLINDQTIVGVVGNQCQDSTSYLLHINKWDKK